MISQRDVRNFYRVGYYSLIFIRYYTGNQSKTQRDVTFLKLIFFKVILNLMAPENHLEWECCFLTCLTLNKLRCEEQASFIKRWAHFDTNAHTKCFKHQNSVLLHYAHSQTKPPLKHFTCF